MFCFLAEVSFIFKDNHQIFVNENSYANALNSHGRLN